MLPSSGTKVRVRFAPSPTGYLHVGGLRTALYNYLFARKKGGRFILRIEDTDQNRKMEGAVDNLIASLRWAGIEFDEGPGKGGDVGPYVQSERLHIYREHIGSLLHEGHAYPCFCTPERLAEMREKQIKAHLPPMYDRTCRNLPKEMVLERLQAGHPYVVRMKIPIGGELTFEDAIRGTVTIANKVLDDQVLLKSDGFPTYHLAVVVDDHLMGITHVIRGEEWLPSTPKHIYLYKAFGWDLPVHAHLPLLLNPDKSKLSKRQGDVAVEDYRAKGYLRDAVINFVAFLGWNPGDEREIFLMKDLEKEFSLERVGKSGAVFNIEKLNWLNQQHIRLKSADELTPFVRKILEDRGITGVTDDRLRKGIELLKERVTTLLDFEDFGGYLFKEPETYDEKARAKSWTPETASHLRALLSKIELSPEFTHAALEQVFKSTAEELRIATGRLIHPVRLAVSGRSVGPGLYELLEFLGKEVVVRRITRAIDVLG